MMWCHNLFHVQHFVIFMVQPTRTSISITTTNTLSTSIGIEIETIFSCLHIH